MSDDAREDQWSHVESPGDVARAVERLASIAAAPYEQRARARFLELLAPSPGQTVLDVGAGTGVVALEVARRVAPSGRVVGLDPSRALLDIAASAARECGPANIVETPVGDARRLPDAAGHFDHAL